MNLNYCACDLPNCGTARWLWCIRNWLENFCMVQQREHNTIVNIMDWMIWVWVMVHAHHAVFLKYTMVKLQGKGHKVKNYGITRRFWSQRIYMCNMKASGLKLMANIKLQIFKRVNGKVKVTRSKIMAPCERSCHKEYTCEIWESYPVWPRLKFLFMHLHGHGCRHWHRHGQYGYDISSQDIHPGSLKIVACSRTIISNILYIKLQLL